MTAGDYEKAYQLWSITPGMNLKSLNNTYEGIKSVIDHNPNLCFVAVANDQIVGTALGATDGRKGYLYHVAIDAEFRGQRVGSQLIERVVQGLKKQGITKIGLFTTNENTEGQAFWKHLGWHQRTDITYLDRDI